MLAFTECMRDHGVDMPDPQMANAGDGRRQGRRRVIAVEGDPNDPTFKKANEACEPLMAEVRSDLDDDPERLAEMKRADARVRPVHARPGRSTCRTRRSTRTVG